jgi:DNA adenine methylase
LKSPLRYVGGKSKYIKYIEEYIPEYARFIDVFCGGGSVSLHYIEKFPEKKYWMNDINRDLFKFWDSLKNKPRLLLKLLYSFSEEYDVKVEEDGRKLYDKILKLFKEGDDIEVGASYFVLNRIVFAGMVGLSSFSKTAWAKNYFTTKKIDNLKNLSGVLQNIDISNEDYKEIFEKTMETDFLFLDPPYEIEHNLYGKKGVYHHYFDHDIFFEEVSKLKCKWMITYNCSDKILERYKKYKIIKKEYSYCVNYSKEKNGNLKRRKNNEVIIMNYG